MSYINTPLFRLRFEGEGEGIVNAFNKPINITTAEMLIVKVEKGARNEGGG